MRLRSVAATLTAFACVAAAIGYSMTAQSADHQDSPATTADPTADINDVYAFMDGPTNVVFVMTVYPNAPAGALFSNTVQYVLHTSSASTFAMATSNVDIIATFDTSQNISLWVGSSEFVTGNASALAGITSADGMVKVFAGLRADPFFFNLDGFKAVAGDIIAAAGDAGLPGAIAVNDAGCPNKLGATATALVTQLGQAPDGGAANNHFAKFNALSIVIELNKSLVTAGGPLVSVWGGTYSTVTSVDAGTEGG